MGFPALETFAPSSLQLFYDHEFDEIIDVRSPSEYSVDHIPGAVSRPVLDDCQRAIVGEIYARQSRHKSMRLGAAFVARNIADMLDRDLNTKAQEFRPLIYCWRGGMRSGALAEICRQIGWQPAVLDGGYKSYRRLVVEALYKESVSTPIILLDGDTGCAKTAILERLRQHGHQVIDLEDLARHRGSVFGATNAEQPTQKSFETRLAQELQALDPDRPVMVEAESNRIGKVTIPPAMWKAMSGAQRIAVTAPLEARVLHIMEEFAHLRQDCSRLASTVDRLRHYHPKGVVREWKDLIAEGEFKELVRQLITIHYDPKYNRQSRPKREQRVCVIEAGNLTDDGIERAASEIGRML
ncbi:MAG: tRNA 2-selenouridine(34) synthase MnmH [Rhodobacteraceae bacterium]|nr:tRNA 2-selenouridine(34) synthase MnmH [Paracoccaceae bacterium]